MTVTVPDTTGVDGETAPAPDADQTVEQDPVPEASVAVEPDTVDPEPDPDPVVEQATETLPPVELETRGIMQSTCEIGLLEGDPEVSMTAPQTCDIDGDPLPVRAEEQISLTLLASEPTVATELFVSTSDDGFLSAGYSYDENLHVRLVATQPGVGEYEGEAIRQLSRDGADGFIMEWSTDVDDAPLPTTEEGGISAQITITCSAIYIEGDDISQVLEQTCSYAGDDARFVPEPEVITIRLFAADPDVTVLAPGTPAFITGTTDSGTAMAGITTGVDSIVRAVGVRPGTGEFDGMLIHDVMHLIVDDAFNVTGTISSTVYPAE